MSLYCQFLGDAVLSLIGQNWRLGHCLSIRIIHQGCCVTFEGPFWCRLHWDLSHLSKCSPLDPWTRRILLLRLLGLLLFQFPSEQQVVNTWALFWVTFWS